MLRAHIPTKPWTNRGTPFISAERMFIAVEGLLFAVDRGTLKNH